ncbi:hypothetical protein C8R46DRAFT_1031004 [Mycena filopes]|nr:hypothetical protein C8R46DRAFT_1031004 [Mycena filopes]
MYSARSSELSSPHPRAKTQRESITVFYTAPVKISLRACGVGHVAQEFVELSRGEGTSESWRKRACKTVTRGVGWTGQRGAAIISEVQLRLIVSKYNNGKTSGHLGRKIMAHWLVLLVSSDEVEGPLLLTGLAGDSRAKGDATEEQGCQWRGVSGGIDVIQREKVPEQDEDDVAEEDSSAAAASGNFPILS